MKAFRIYQYENGTLRKPSHNRPVRHDYESQEEAVNAAQTWTDITGGQIAVVHYESTYNSRIVNMLYV